MNFYQNTDKKGQAGISFSLAVLLFLAISFIGQSILISFVDSESSVFVLVNGCFSALAIFTVILIDTRLNKVSFSENLSVKKFNPLFLVCCFLLSAGMFFGLGTLNSLIAEFLRSIGLRVSAFDYKIKDFGEFILFSVVYAILPAVAEESLFRGLIQEKVKGKFLIKTLFISGLLFALYHCNSVQLVYQFVYGALLSLLALKSGSVIPAIISHFINNFAILLFNYIGFEPNLFNPLLIIGGIIALIGFVLLTNVLGKPTKIEQTEEKSSKEGLIYALAGGLICVVTIIAGVI